MRQPHMKMEQNSGIFRPRLAFRCRNTTKTGIFGLEFASLLPFVKLNYRKVLAVESDVRPQFDVKVKPSKASQA